MLIKDKNSDEDKNFHWTGAKALSSQEDDSLKPGITRSKSGRSDIP
jgi:hypothetical protein